MANGFDWVVVDDRNGKAIGMVGFVGNDVVAIAAFYDDRDADKNGEVSLGERVVSAISPIGLKGKAVAEVAMQGRNNLDIEGRDPSYRQLSASVFTQFGASMATDALWAAYFKRGVGALGRGIAQQIGGNMVKQLMIRKGFEKVARGAFDAATSTAGV